MTRQQILSRMYDDAQINAQNQGWPGYIADRAKEWLIPGYWQLKLRGHLPTNLLGEDLEKDMNYGFSLSSNSQFEEWAGKRTFQLEKDNPAMAVEWIGAMMGMSNREKDINNLLTATDFIGKPLGAGIVTGAVKRFLPRDLVKTALRAGFREPVSRAAVEEGVGNIGKAASSDVAQQILDNTKGKSNPVGSIMRNLPGAFNASIDNIRNNPGRLRREGVERILQNLEEARDRIVGDAVRMQNVDKVPILSALETKTDEFLKEIADRFPEIHNNLLNNSIRFDPLLNGHWADFYLGKTGTDLFSSKQEAERFIKSNKLLDAITDPDYAHRSIIISKPMPSEWVKDILLNTEETKTPLNWLNSLYNGFIGKIRTPEETSSAAERSAKHIATYGPAVLNEIAKTVTKPFSKLGSWSSIPYSNKRQKWLQFQTVLSAAEKDLVKDPDTGKMVGRRFNTPNELDEYYHKSIGRLPDEQETAGYFSWKAGEELYQAWRDLQNYKNLHDQGAQHIVIRTGDPTKGTAWSRQIKEKPTET